jgi:hypothetical protein
MHHCRLRCGLSAFFQQAAHRLVRDGVLDDLQLDQLVSQQAQAPVGLAGRRLCTGAGDEFGFLYALQLAHVCARRRAVVEGRLQPLFDVLFAHPRARRRADLDRLGDRLVRQTRSVGALVRLQQDARMRELAGRLRAGSEQAFQGGAFGGGEGYEGYHVVFVQAPSLPPLPPSVKSSVTEY